MPVKFDNKTHNNISALTSFIPILRKIPKKVFEK